jgi:hypothetical protein
VNHCLAQRGLPLIPLSVFRQCAGNGYYPEGDFDNTGLQRNLESQGCFFQAMQGGDYQEAVRQVTDDGLLSIFNGSHALGCVIHTPDPRHWIAVVPPATQTSVGAAALLCDSRAPQPYVVSVDDMVLLFTTMGSHHMRAASAQSLDALQREEYAAAWSAYAVTC